MTEDVELPEIYQILNVHMFGLCKVLGLQRLGELYMTKSECVDFAVTR